MNVWSIIFYLRAKPRKCVISIDISKSQCTPSLAPSKQTFLSFKSLLEILQHWFQVLWRSAHLISPLPAKKLQEPKPRKKPPAATLWKSFMKCPCLVPLNFREKHTCSFKISLSMSSKDAPASAADTVQAIAIPDTLFPHRSFCSSAHTFHRATRSHQASSRHRAPSKDDDF